MEEHDLELPRVPDDAGPDPDWEARARAALAWTALWPAAALIVMVGAVMVVGWFLAPAGGW